MMPIIVDRNTVLLVQGITGHQGKFHTKAMKEFGTKISCGVTPGKGGQDVEGIPVFSSVKDAMDVLPDDEKPNTSIIFVPASFAKDAVIESMENGIKTVIIITERIPVHDSIKIFHYAKYMGVTLVGPNTPGVISPAERVKVGIMPSTIFMPGNIGIASRSGTLTYEIVNALSENGYGQSTCVGLGGDQVTGMNFIDAIKMFEDDDETDVVVLIGEIGGTAEEMAAQYIEKNCSKKYVAYIAGRTAPHGKRMGHAGAIIERGMGTAESKIKAFEKAGVPVAMRPVDVPRIIDNI